MPKSNADAFPAHGNLHGKTAGVKIDFAFDLLSGNIVSHSLQAATEQDKSIGKEFVTQVRRGDLVLRDMGYFCLSEFTAIEQLEAYWLTRLPLTTGAMLDERRTLEKVLKSCRGDLIDIIAIVGKQGKKCRLVGLRAASEVTAARRALRRKKARDCGKPPCPKGLIRDGWHLMLTNLSEDQATVQQLASIYRARWAVEIQFRAWKQALNLGKALNRRSNEHHLHAIILAGMIAHQLGMRIAKRIGNMVGRARLSYEKLYDLLAVRLIKSRDLSEFDAFEPDLRHIERDKRTRKSPVESGILALT
jgi:Transposase DDE domain